jgi:hypothetical protein
VKLTKKQSLALDKQIEALYVQYASGRQINIMNISPLFDSARQSYFAGETLENAVKLAIEEYCEAIK